MEADFDRAKDEATFRSIVDGSITELADGLAKKVRPYALYGNENLKKVSLPNVETVGRSAFYDCKGLTEINLPKASLIDEYGIYECTSLKSIVLPSALTVGRAALNRCSSLEVVDLPVVSHIGSGCFWGDSKLKAIIIRSPQMCTYDSGTEPGSSSLKIYVPQELLEEYKTATCWKNLAKYMVAIEGSEYENT